MSSSEVSGTLSDGRRYRATTYALEIAAEDGRRLEQIDLQDISDIGRDHAAISIRMRDGAARIFDLASIDEAGQLEHFLRSNLRSPQRPAAVSPPVSQQTVRVEPSSGSSAAGIIVGVLLLIVIVVLIVIYVTRDGDDNDDETPIDAPTEQPAEQPTEETPADPTPEPDASPEANHRENPAITVAIVGYEDTEGRRAVLNLA